MVLKSLNQDAWFECITDYEGLRLNRQTEERVGRNGNEVNLVVDRSIKSAKRSTGLLKLAQVKGVLTDGNPA